MSYEADVRRASRHMPLVKEGFAASLTEAATRFAISHPAVGTILVGMATPQQFEAALAAIEKGPLPRSSGWLRSGRDSPASQGDERGSKERIPAVRLREWDQ
jgi:aryl-alcohol dehydrogenase-like predicted oxidoreductase